MKVKCAMCKNEVERVCEVKGTTIKLNKDRKCNYYDHSNEKELAMLKRKAHAMDMQDKAYNRKHPITGDLSKFKTSATK